MNYIEENMKTRFPSKASKEEAPKRFDPQEELYRITSTTVAVRAATETKKLEEGSVTNSMAMLTAIPEVDLGIECVRVFVFNSASQSASSLLYSTRLKNIEETEKAKRLIAEDRSKVPRTNRDEEHLVATRFHNPRIAEISDRDIRRRAIAEAEKHLREGESRGSHNWKEDTATDEIVLERFKKRMRK